MQSPHPSSMQGMSQNIFMNLLFDFAHLSLLVVQLSAEKGSDHPV